MNLPKGFKSMPVKKKEPNELYIKISNEEGTFVELLNQEIEELQRSMKKGMNKNETIRKLAAAIDNAWVENNDGYVISSSEAVAAALVEECHVPSEDGDLFALSGHITDSFYNI